MSETMVRDDAVRSRASYVPTTGEPMSMHMLREPADSTYLAPRPKPPAWSEKSKQMFDFMEIAPEYRDTVPYRREFLDRYEPNVDSLLPASLADCLHQTARWENGPCRFDGALNILSEFMTDFCWSSSKLEGCRFTPAQTETLLTMDEPRRASVAEQDKEARILFNHRHALHALAFSGHPRRLNLELILKIHGCLVEGLEPADRCGQVRRIDTYVTGTAYQPSTDHALLSDMLRQLATKAQAIRNPVEAAFFLWIHFAYLQAFSDGNKRMGRLCANAPLLFGDCAPLSFGGVEPRDHVVALLGVYERNDVSVAADLFEWMYRRSMQKFPWMFSEPASKPDLARLRRHQQAIEVVQAVVLGRRSAAAAMAQAGITPMETEDFAERLERRLQTLGSRHAQRFHIGAAQIDSWIAAGRPR